MPHRPANSPPRCTCTPTDPPGDLLGAIYEAAGDIGTCALYACLLTLCVVVPLRLLGLIGGA